MKHQGGAVVTGALLLAGCAGAAPKPAQSPVSAVEITENGEELAIPPSGTTDVDVNSSVRLRVDKAEAQKSLASSVGQNSEKIADLETRTVLLRAAMGSQQKALEVLTADLKQPPPPAQVASAMRALAAVEAKALDDLQNVSTRAEINQDLAAGVGKSYEATVARLSKRNDAIQADLSSMMETLGRARWRMQAMLYSSRGPTELHLDGYDDIAVDDPHFVNKLALPANLLATAEQAKSAAADLRNLEQTLSQAQAALALHVTELRDRVLKVAAALEALPDLLSSLEKAPWAGVKEAKAVPSTLQGAKAAAAELVPGCRDGIAMLRGLGGAPPSVLLRQFGAADSPVRKCVELLVKKGPELVKAGQALRAEATALAFAVKADVHLAKTLGPETVKSLEDSALAIESGALEDFSNYWASITRLLSSGVTLATNPEFGAGDHAKDRAYRDVGDASIDLVRTARASGDLVYYGAAVVTDGRPVRQWTSAPLRVVVTGFHVDVSASVVFVRALSTQSQDSSFPAAPAATAALHYGPKRRANENQGSGVWKFLDPGIGLHVAYLDLGPKVPAGSTTPPSDPATEIGMGATFQLFGDVLQGGVAYDLQVGRPYWFFGIGLQTATKLGLTLPAGG